MNLFSEDEIENYLIAVYSGLIAVDQLSIDYHLKVGGKLYEAIEKGFGKAEPFTIYAQTFDKLTSNIYAFSAAKQYQQVRIMSRYINKVNERASYSEFKKLAKATFDEFNDSYLETEFNTAVGQSQTARDWLQFEEDKDIFPYLQYNTQEDVLVRDSHSVLNGIIKRVDDPFWNTYNPLNGWNCRCFVTQLDEGVETNTDNLVIDKKDFPELFQFNSGKQKLIFDPKQHPYFKVGRGHAGLRANNFNLPVPQ